MESPLVRRTLEFLDAATAALPGGGEHRPGQRRMAAAVAETIEGDGHLVVQAGTGTGKSLAYLCAAAASGRRTVVATATRALQDQLAGKDLPFLADVLPVPLSFAVLKGRSNYLCLQRLDELAAAGAGESRLDLGLGDATVEPEILDAVGEAAAISETGERAELGVDLDDATWRLVSVTADECPGASRCPRGDECLAEAARRRAAEVDILVVNLHLFALDVALGGGVVLPEADLVVVDEAHQLEDIAAAATGRSVSPGRLRAVARRVRALVAGSTAATRLDAAADRLAATVSALVGERLGSNRDDELEGPLTAARAAVAAAVEEIRSLPAGAPADLVTRARRARSMCDALLVDIDAVAAPTDDEVRWVDGPERNPALTVTPVEVGALLADKLWSDHPAVCTSATIPPSFVTRVGLPATTVELDVGSPFDHEGNALLYCAAHLPDPRRPDADEARWAELEELIVAAGGRTLALFTSFAAMNRATDHLTGRLPWTVLRQGDAAKATLLEAFNADETACLFATLSFWQGVDVPGRSCILVVIDRLPFPRPDEPVLMARRERAGSAAFRAVDLPRAATLLAQGAGRLLRRADDR
ncbi:MAG: ATP-dependent DNA helicase, partial [Actinomyces sp.]